jgi:hypothetical protein
MTRSELARYFGKRRKFRGVFRREGTKAGFEGRVQKTMLLVNVKDVETGATVTDHLWFNATKGFGSLGLKRGDEVEFEARVDDYMKGYVNESQDIDNTELDYRLVFPSKLKKANRSTRQTQHNSVMFDNFMASSSRNPTF